MPFMVINLESPYSTDEVRRRLESIVRPAPSEFVWPMNSPGAAGQSAPFEGSVGSQGFKIRRIITNRNSFLPLVRGSIIQGDAGLLMTWSLYAGFHVEAVKAERLIRDCVGGRRKRG